MVLMTPLGDHDLLGGMSLSSASHGTGLVPSWLQPRPDATGVDAIISEVWPGLIYVTGIVGARALERIQALGIKSVLDVAAGDPRFEAGLELPIVAECGSAAQLLQKAGVQHVEEIPLSDSAAEADGQADLMGKAVDSLQSLSLLGPVLLHCTVGVSRSCAVATAWLIRFRELSLRDAFARVRGARECAYPNFGLWCWLREYERSTRGESTVSLDELESHDEVTFVAEEGDEDDDGSGWGERPGVP